MNLGRHGGLARPKRVVLSETLSGGDCPFFYSVELRRLAGSPWAQETVNNPRADNAAITVDTDAPSGYVVEYSSDEGMTWLSLGFVAAYNDEGQYTQAPSFYDDETAEGLVYRIKAVNYTGESEYLSQ